jgi:hypothetical protein
LPLGTVSTDLENTVLQKPFSRILGCALLLYGSTALAFTLITLPQEQVSPGNTITDTTTLEAQVQPIAGTIRAQLLGHLRPRASAKTAQLGRLLAANAYAGSRSDVDYLAAAPGDSSGAGSGMGGGNSESWWVSAATNSLENTFSRTAFYGATHNLLAGFDLTRSDKYVFGVSVGQEASNFTTTFNTGNEKTRGFNINPYFAFLLSDTWSLDLIGGYGQFNTKQSRAIGSLTVPLATVAVDSEFDSKRGFISTNLTNVSTWGNWKLTGSLGYLASRRDNDAYVESNGNAVAESKQTAEQWNLLGEAAYGRGNSEAFFGAMYENTRDPQKIAFTTGEQPANDPDSVLLTAGWRHFGKGLTANFMFSSRVAQEQVKEYGFSMMLRIDL